MATERPDVKYVLDKLAWMRQQRIWPNGERYLWTDAFGVVLLASLFWRLEDGRYLDDAKRVVREVERVLGRPRGLRIGEAPDRDGQYFHYLAMWLFALNVLGGIEPEYRAKALQIARDIHRPFVRPGIGVSWKMLEDLRAPYPGYGRGAIDPFHGYVVYRLLGERELAGEIGEMRELMDESYRTLAIAQDLGIGMMLWLSSFFPTEPWAETQQRRSLHILDRMWIEPAGYFCRQPELPHTKFAFTNYGVSLGLQAVGAHLDRVERLENFFETYRSGDEYDRNAITHVMACTSRFPGLLLPR